MGKSRCAVARLNIEDCWWTDPRRTALAEALGNEPLADGTAIRAWRLAQEFWKHGRGLVPKAMFDMLKSGSNLVQVGLAEIRGDGVYIRGSSAYLDWIAERREAARLGGKKSAEARATKPQANANQNQPNLKQTQPSYSSSFSGSKKKSNTALTGVRAEYSKAFEEVWEIFGRTGKKLDAFRAFEDLNLSAVEFLDLLKAIPPYLADCKAHDRRSQYLATFLRDDWTIWLERRPFSTPKLEPKNLETL